MKKFTIAVLAFFMMCSVSFAVDADDVKLPEMIKAGTSDLLLNGSGVRTKLFLNLYVGGLYLEKKSTDVEAAALADKAMAIKLNITSSMISGEKMANATNEGFEKSTNGNTDPIKTEIATMINVLRKEIKVSDVFDFVYDPAEGTKIMKNGELKATIKGMEFKKALFGIWLGQNPCQDDLKVSMSGA